MNKILSSLIIFLLSSALFAAPIDKVVFFGDSLSDDGNLYQLALKIIPKSPPYFKGRFTNGPTWSERVGKHLYDKFYIDYKIYAYGGATAVWHLPTPKFIAPTILSAEVYEYLFETFLQDRSNTLFVIWIGGNDYFFGDDIPDPQEATSTVVNRIIWAVSTLQERGGRHFFIMGLPDLSKIPFAKVNDVEEKLYLLSHLHNQKLQDEVQILKRQHPELNIQFYDVETRFRVLIDNPEFYNQKYGIHITNTHEECWKGGYTVRNLVSKETLMKELSQSLKSEKLTLKNSMSVSNMADLILTNPELKYVYSLSKLYEDGIVPCENSENYVFWDAVHPTDIVHRILSIQVSKTIDKMLESS